MELTLVEESIINLRVSVVGQSKHQPRPHDSKLTFNEIIKINSVTEELGSSIALTIEQKKLV